MNADITRHAREVLERGVTVIPGQLDADTIDTLNASADRALDVFSDRVAAGDPPAKTEVNEFVRSARCFYCWEPKARALLDHPTVHALGEAVLGRARLWDLVLLEALPLPDGGDLGSFDWHRDFAAQAAGERPSYMWMFFCLTDVTAENGGTWVLPGSQFSPESERPRPMSSGQERPAKAVQVEAKAGDIAVINPQMFHAVGQNNTDARRRLLNVGLCRSDREPLYNHWEVGRPLFADDASTRLSQLLKTRNWRLDRRVDLVPDDWPAANESGLAEGVRRLGIKADARLRSVARTLLARTG